jgi:CRISPR-associated protein Csd1
MSWAKNLVQTYDLCQAIVGIEDEARTILLPIGHLLTELNYVVHLRKDGTFYRAENYDKKTLISIPCTEDSESRSGKNATDFPHPLFDQIKFLLTNQYLKNLEKWLAYLHDKNEYTLTCSRLKAVYQYMKNKTLIQDLEVSLKKAPNKDLLVAFAVHFEDYLEDRLWKIREISNAWTAYYLNEIVAKNNNKAICYISGNEDYFTEKHPKSINRFAGNSKLITGNDKTNYTFRGRYEKPYQAVTVGYETSQKAHQTLRWLISKSSFYRCGTQAIIAWAIDKNIYVPNFTDDSFRLFFSVNNIPETDEEKISQAEGNIFIDYSKQLQKSLQGYNTTEKIKNHECRVAIMATDASTTGRLAITYYREFSKDEYEERIILWHNHCKWYQPFAKHGFFIGAPSIKRIIRAVLGLPRSSSDEAYEKLEKNVTEQLVHCIFDGQKIPLPLVTSAVYCASNPLIFEKTGDTSDTDKFWEWKKVLGTACALVKKYYYDYRKEDYKVELETSRCDRDYLYGRLLAIADRIESHARSSRGKDSNNTGTTNALRYMSVFAQHPFRTWNLLFTQQLNPYIQQLNGAEGYLRIIGSIKELFKPGDFESDAALDGRYLLGFFAQRQYFFKHQNKDVKGGEGNESNK